MLWFFAFVFFEVFGYVVCQFWHSSYGVLHGRDHGHGIEERQPSSTPNGMSVVLLH